MNLTRKSKAAGFSILSNTCLILLKLAAGLITGSVSLIAEAIHNVMDLAAAVVAFVSVRVSDKPSGNKHPFGVPPILVPSTMRDFLLFPLVV